jgi:hypothetical protein
MRRTRRTCWTPIALSLPLLALLLSAQALAGPTAAPAPAAGAAELVYRSPAGAEFRVTAKGLTSIRLDGRELASGEWSVFNAEGWFKDGGTGKVDTKKLLDSTIAVVDGKTARVVHKRGDVVCTTEYRFDGDDVLISSRVENNHATDSMNIAGFSGLTFHFAKPPEGLLMVQHISYFQAHGVGLCHPGDWSKIGGSYAVDGSAGVGTSPANTGMTRTLTLWDYSDWSPAKRENSPDRRLLYFVVAGVPPRGARTYDFLLRVSTKTDWKYLLAPYREHFQRTFAPVQYKADYRWVATDYLNQSQQAISPTNPYGFHGGHRRIDTAKGATEFCDKVIGLLKDGGGQGVIVWGQGGEETRGGMYRPDFDVLPPEVEANWPAIAARFKEAGFKLGVTTRPRHMAVRCDWKQDDIIDINPLDAGHRAMLWKRFENMMAKGCTLFYLDSFGSSFEDVLLMQFLRQKMGPGVLTFCEHQCDAIMPYSGGYSETTFSPADKDKGKAAGYGLWSGLRTWEIYQYLVPGCQMSARLYQGEEKVPADFERPDEFFFRNHISPLLPVGGRATRVAEIKAAEGKYLGADGAWK